jgi:hypothetical protein
MPSCSRGATSKARTLSHGINLAVLSRPCVSETLCPAPAEAQLKEYEGNNSFSRTLGLRVFASGSKLMIQGTGQAPLEAAPFDKDEFVTELVGAEVAFERDAGGKVIALTLKQRGEVLRGERY